MKITLNKKTIIITILILLINNNILAASGFKIKNEEKLDATSDCHDQCHNLIKYIEFNLNFSDPEIVQYGDYSVIRVNETNLNKFHYLGPKKPVLPVNITLFKLEFGSKIININYTHSKPEIIDIEDKKHFSELDNNVDPYPVNWVLYNTGGGLLKGTHTTFLSVRVYPVRYFPFENQLQFIRNITVNLSYMCPSSPIINNDILDLLIITPSNFQNHLAPLVEHKNKMGVRTQIVSLSYIYNHIWEGRDKPEKIKYFIREAIEKTGIKYVLLVGGLKRQTCYWNLPIRFSNLVSIEQDEENPELSFISDLYYADIYDGEGKFCSWDSNFDNIFSVWNESYKEEMDLYPDVYLGRLPCRNILEVKIMVDKIINYEKNKCDDEWFNKFILIAGDTYNDTNHFNEGELIAEKAIEYMPDYTPLRLYASDTQDINRFSVNNLLNEGAGFVFFCGHGSVSYWTTRFPPNSTITTTGYRTKDMNFLRNKNKLPIVVVGGCNIGQFNVGIYNIFKGIKEHGLKYFSMGLRSNELGKFWLHEWVHNCWAWMLTSKKGGGAIATITNTGAGSHGFGDMDNNSIADYIEILDGWLELHFYKLINKSQNDILGENHGDTISDYLNRFIDEDGRIEVKMVQQWELFGDPSLKIGGYSSSS